MHRWSGSWTEVVPYGPAVTEALRCEAAAHAGQIAISDTVVADLGATRVRRRADGVALLRSSSRRTPVQAQQESTSDADWRQRSSVGPQVLPPAVRDAVHAGVEPAHRPAAIGFVAVSGLDRLAGNPAEIKRAADMLFAAVDEASSALDVTLISTDVAPNGIKLILAAGVPTTVGDDGERLVIALQQIVAATDRLDVRAGANIGLIFAADVGHPRRRTYTVMGDAVNLSARLAYRAEPGKVLASAALVDTLPSRFGIAWVPSFTVKGKRAAQRAAIVASTVSDPADIVTSSATLLPLRGRRGEVRRLRAAVSTSPVIDVFGPAGSGSSRIVSEALDGHQRVTTLQVNVIDSSTPLLAVRRLAEALGGVGAWESISLAAFGRRTKHMTATTTGAGVEAVAGIARDFAQLWPPELIVVIDGHHHLDEASWSVIRALATTLQSTPQGRRLVVTGRQPNIGTNALQLEVGPLDADDVRKIVIDASDRPLSDADLDAIVRAAAGSPLLAQGLARLGPRSELPPTLEALVATRIDRLPTAVARLVRAVAVIGPSCNVADAAAIAEIASHEICSAAEQSDGTLVLEGDDLRFPDEATRVVAAAGLAVARRRVVHEHAARRLEQTDAPSPALVADHWFEAGDDAGTLRWAQLAGEAAFGAGASAEASHHFERALLAAQRLHRPDAEIVGMAERLATTAHAARQANLEAWALHQAVGATTSPRAAARLMVRQATCARTSGRLRAASTYLGRARRTAPDDDAAVQCELLIEQAWIAVWSDRWDRALELATSASRAATETDEPALQFHAWSLIQQSRSAKGLPGADTAGQEALRAARASGDERLVGLAEGNLALIADNRGRWKQAVNGHSRSSRAFRRSGDVVNVAASQLNRSTILVELGDVETAYALAVDAARVFAAAGDAAGAALATGLSLRAMVRAGLGDGTQVAGIETCVAVLAAEGNEEETAFQDVGLIESMLLTGNIAAATQRAMRLIDVVDRFGDDHLLPTTVRRLLSVATHAAGDHSAAEQWLHEARARADLHRIMPEQAAVAAIDARRAADDRAPDLQHRVDVSARLDEALGVLSRPLYQHGRDSGEP
jgi:class 3 adenylate cyclase/tetratricopeptide (TPR) repeat protein